MFTGHYAPGAALKPLTPKVPLWHYFVAVQFLDFLWAAIIITGIEKARIVPGFLEASDLDLYFMPYTHSLAAAALWALFGTLAYGFIINRAASLPGAILIGAAIFSHWVADLIVHSKDLALYPGSDLKFGFGVWSSIWISKGLELGLFLAGFILYVGGTSPRNAAGRIAPYVVIAVLIGTEVYAAIGEPPTDIKAFALLALVSYVVIAALAFWLDRTRVSGRR
jgi:membrane-bound metal-dependent hydrolase YbcI (DUF457 family)